MHDAHAFRARPGRRLGDRLTKALVTTAGAALLVAGLIFDAFVYVSLRDAMVDDLTVQARIVAENSSAAILFDDRGAASQTLAGLQAAPAILYAELSNEQGRVVGSYGAAQSLRGAPPGAAGHGFAGNRVWVSQPVHEGTRSVGSVHLVATLDPLYRRVAMHVAITVLAAIVAFAFAFVLVLRIRRDIDATESRLDYLAHYDPVTGLPNRHAANEQIERLISTVGRGSDGFALMLLDLDDFKSVNDTLGHAVGDQLLRALAGRLSGCMRPVDVAFRFGGDEFVILAPGITGRTQLEVLGHQAMRALRDPIMVAGHEVRTRASIGVAQFPADAHDAASLVRAADTAMYDAKAQGKNICSIFRTDMERGARARMRLESDLRHAIARGELRLLYQPIIDLKQHRMVGVEALLRWRHPELGLVPPTEFIAIAESSGIIVDIGQWVLLTACRQARAWSDAGHAGVHVAVNVSARQIRRGLRAQVDDALAATGADPHALAIEITEHSMVEDIDSNVAELAALGELGIQVAVDDFGTGLSSLAYLKRLPINKLKIDRTFVKDLPQDADDAAIARAIVSMARSLGLTVVAEGVETEAQRDFLIAQGCECAQGFLYSPPVDAQVIEELLQRHTRPGPVWPGAAGSGRVPLRLA
ncbi:EAL domain-containing protein [Piscinibacter sp. XHJ-5]|uniref:putative bifunctional diguanylate cyclase/phosphodiesterase n=1 Tax=Piscinibacter sp. XHJ-5 TaxID=3037797 RepID=UPI002452BC13|nr:EAL domain-containing protein [Piscinibacter sp. XHJ-5]